jgi:hypothetical protein
MAKNILSEAPRKSIVLTDGKEYVLSPVNLNILADLEEEFGCSLEELKKRPDKQSFVILRALLLIFLRENYPTITKRQIGKLVSIEIIPEISKAIAEVWGKPQKEMGING